MSELHRGGERGASILASLVIAAALGGAALLADFAASPSSQVAAPVTAAPAVQTNQAAAQPKVLTEEEKKKQEIAAKCDAAIARALTSGSTKVKFDSRQAKGQKTNDDCVAAIPDANPAYKSKGFYRCVGKSAQVMMKDDGTMSINWQANANVLAGTCKTIACRPAGYLSVLGQAASNKCFVSELDSINKSKIASGLENPNTFLMGKTKGLLVGAEHDMVPIGGTLLNRTQLDDNQQRLLNEALGRDPNIQNRTIPLDSNGDFKSSTYDQIKEFTDADSNKDAEKFSKEVTLGEGLKDQSRLCTYQGPCQYGTMDPCTGKCPVRPGPPQPPPGPTPPPSTFPPPSPPGPEFKAPGPFGPQSLGGQQPPPGNGFPQQPGSCPPGPICGQNVIYARNNQCVDQVMQQCQYGCTGSQGSAGFMGFGSSPGTAQCNQAPNQGQNCPTAPTQPTSGCTNGQWKPTYGGQSNSCVSGWQCVPTGSGGSSQIKAEISCQPKVGDVGMTIAISYSCSSGTSEGSGFDTNGAKSGAATVTLAKPPGNTNTATYTLKCVDGTETKEAQCSVQVAKASIVLVANPEAVRRGETSRLGWITSGMESCVISSPDDDDFTDENADETDTNGTVITPPLRRSTDFVLKCETAGGATKEQEITVNVI